MAANSFSTFHLLQVKGPAQEVAKQFAVYCRQKQILTRGLCRIGYIRRRPSTLQLSDGGVQSTNSDSSRGADSALPLRGLIASKSISKNTNVVMLPLQACLGPSNALKCIPFFDIFPREVQESYFLSEAFVQNSRVAEQSLIRHNQLLLALYIAYLYLVRAFDPGTLATLAGSELLWYLDFLPRSEGDFVHLEAHMASTLHTAEACRAAASCLAAHFNIPQTEIQPLLVWALCMIYSRMIPIDDRGLLKDAFRDTAVATFFDKVAESHPCQPNAEISPTESVVATAADASPGVQRPLAEPITFLCPIIDMCNHSEKENVAVMVPDHAPAGARRVICLRTLREVAEGEELVMTYSRSGAELRTIWGMPEVLV